MPFLKEGAGGHHRAHVHYVVTEHGVATSSAATSSSGQGVMDIAHP